MLEQTSEKTMLRSILMISIVTWFIVVIGAHVFLWLGCSIPAILVSSEFSMSAIGIYFLCADVTSEKQCMSRRLGLASQIIGLAIGGAVLSVGLTESFFHELNMFTLLCIILGAASMAYRIKEILQIKKRNWKMRSG